MNENLFSSLPSNRRVGLIDLVQTPTTEASHAFAGLIRRAAEEEGGRVVLANKAVHPMIVPNEQERAIDDAMRLLVVTQYPKRQAAEAAFAKRERWDRENSQESVQTFAVRPVNRIESLLGRTLPHTLGRLGRQPVPEIKSAESRDALIESALVLGEQPDEARWITLADRAGDRPIWMLNFLEFAKTAVYAEAKEGASPADSISGARAYRRYGSGMASSLAAVGGRVGWSGYPIGQLSGPDDGRWHQIAIAVYPSAAAMMTMLSLPKYKAAHVHRAAALARTRLLATQPLDG
ncbi:MAG: hypothetical protein VX252_16285 [Myxococcota bacterium]|nr:hypothetical protein [Myxococcota bacterium]